MNVNEKIARILNAAGVALRMGLHDDWTAAFETVKATAEEFGPRSVFIAAAFWADRYIEHAIAGPHNGPVEIGQYHYVNKSTGAMTVEDDLPPGVFWASRLIRARASFDLQAFTAVLAEPRDGEQLGDHIGWLLETVAATINGLPRGFAYMGKDIHVER
jgi:hypothetical protein